MSITAIDILLIIVILAMTWGLQQTSQVSNETRMQIGSTNKTDDALTIIRAIQRPGSQNELSERRLKSYRDAVSQSQERIDTDDDDLDAGVEEFNESINKRNKIIDGLDLHHQKSIEFIEDVTDLNTAIHEINGALRTEANQARSNNIAVENRIRDLETRSRDTAHNIEEVRGWLRL
jgi:chromosome segregation ATPase